MYLRTTLITLTTLSLVLSSNIVPAAPLMIAPEQLHDLRGQRTQLDAKVKELNEIIKQISVSQADNSSAKESIKLLEAESKKAKANLEKKQAYDRENPGEITEQLRAAEEHNKQATRALKDAEEKRADTESNFNKLNASAVREYAEFKRLQKSYEGDVDRVVDHQLQERFRALQVSKVMEVSAQVSCGDESITACKERSKKAAELKASEQGSVVLVNSLTEVKNFKLTKEELRSEVRATLSDEKILSQNFIGDSGFETKISVKVEPAISASLREQMAGAIRAEIYTMAGGRIDYAQVQNPSSLQEPRADEAISASKSAVEEHTVPGGAASKDASDSPPTLISANNPQSQKVGDIVATIKNVIVSKNMIGGVDEIRVMVDFFNQSDEMLHVIEDHFGNGNFPSLTDENGNSFQYFGGQQGKRTAFVNGANLNPKSISSFVLNFKTSLSSKKVGSEFAVTIPFWIKTDGAASNKAPEASVSFTNLVLDSNGKFQRFSELPTLPNTPLPLSTNNQQSQKVGDIVATIKNVIVSKNMIGGVDEIRVMVDFFNQSDEMLHVIEDHFGNGNFPSLTDENGNSFQYFGGQQGKRTAFVNGVNLNPKSISSFVLNFKTSLSSEKVGSEFAVTIPFWLKTDGAGSNKAPESSVSFTNIKAQRSR